jgi:hypothetical protein
MLTTEKDENCPCMVWRQREKIRDTFTVIDTIGKFCGVMEELTREVLMNDRLVAILGVFLIFPGIDARAVYSSSFLATGGNTSNVSAKLNQP